MTKPSYPLEAVVLVSGNGSNLQAIIDAIDAGDLQVRLSAVISNRSDAYALQRAYRAGVPIEVLPDEEFQTRKSFDAALKNRLIALSPDLIIMAGFMRILGPEVVHPFEGKMINVHPALLPKYRGLHTHAKALAAGDALHGCSIHFVTEELDGGPLICQVSLPIDAEDDVDRLKQKVQGLEHIYYPKVIGWFVDNRLHMQADGVYLDGEKLPDTGKQYHVEFSAHS